MVVKQADDELYNDSEDYASTSVAFLHPLDHFLADGGLLADTGLPPTRLHPAL